MIHNWGESVSVRPRTAGVLEENATLVSNYVLLQRVQDITMYPTLSLNGENAVARFNSVIVAPEGSHVDTGNRLLLNAPNTRGEIIARTLTTGGTIINRGFIGGSCGTRPGPSGMQGGLILGEGRMPRHPRTGRYGGRRGTLARGRRRENRAGRNRIPHGARTR